MNWAILLAALMQVESNGSTTVVGDNGEAVGCLQIHDGVIEDCNRFRPEEQFTRADRLNPQRSKQMAVIYLAHYGRAWEQWSGEPATAEDYARIWNGGYRGLKEHPHATDHYWSKVKGLL